MEIYDAKLARESKNFTGSTTWYPHPLGIIYTDGIMWFQETLHAYWLINDIALFSKKFHKEKRFMSIYFSVENNKGKLTLTDKDGRKLFGKLYDYSLLEIDKLSFRNCKLDEFIKFFLAYDGGLDQHVLMLPSEY